MDIETYLTGQAEICKSIKAKTITTTFRGDEFAAAVTIYVKGGKAATNTAGTNE